MPECRRDEVSLHYEVSGPNDGPTLVLIAGLGEQIGSVEFPEEHVGLFVEQGFRVVRLDNRDTGLSVVDGVGAVDIRAMVEALDAGRETGPAPYNLHAMADDVVAVLDDLGVERANLIGASLGGYIVRWAALRHPDRIASITIVMSGSAAAPGESGPALEPDVVNALMDMVEPRERSAAIEFGTENWRWMWGSEYPFEEEWVRERVAYAFDRAYRPDGISRLLAAALDTPNLWTAQKEIRCPSLVIHGGSDPIFSRDHGEAIAAQIPGAELWLDPRMGHVPHREQWQEMAQRAAKLSPL